MDRGEIVAHEFQRAFQAPTGLDDGIRIALEVCVPPIVGFSPAVSCWLNGEELNGGEKSGFAGGPWRFPILRNYLRATNQLVVRATWPVQGPELTLPQVALILAGTAEFGN